MALNETLFNKVKALETETFTETQSYLLNELLNQLENACGMGEMNILTAVTEFKQAIE